MREPRAAAPLRPVLLDEPSQFLLLERAVEVEYRPLMLKGLQSRVDSFAESRRGEVPDCDSAGSPWYART